MSNDATPTTAAANDALLSDPLLDWSDQRDFGNARHGFLAALDPPVITAADGRAVWDLEQYAFLDAQVAPSTVNPSLWRQA